jgi:glyoxylate reductase
MAKPLVVLAHALLPEVVRTRLSPQAQVIVAPNRRALLKAVRDADGLITLVTHAVDQELLSHAPRLKVVGNFAVGLDNIDLRACRARKIRVVHTPDVLTRATAECAAALLLAAARRIPEGERLCRAGRFTGWTPTLLLGKELRGRTAVLVGRGRIGTETARVFRALGLKVLWITREDGAAAIHRKLRKAQVLSLHIPLTKETRHWLDAKRISLLPRDAIVINTARGPIIDEAALERALRSQRIFAAGLDVFEREPRIPLTLRRLPNVVLLPHLGSATEETRRAMAELVIDGVLGVLGGKHPWNEVKSRA